jgi:hypothetical protein
VERGFARHRWAVEHLLDQMTDGLRRRIGRREGLRHAREIADELFVVALRLALFARERI